MKTLVCVVGQLRAADVTWDSFANNVVEALRADVAVCVDDDTGSDNPYWRNAAFRFTDPDRAALAARFDDIQRKRYPGRSSLPQWRQLLEVPGNWLGGIEPQERRTGAGAVLLYKKWRFLERLKSNGLIDRYERFVITRSDFLWLAPHCPLDALSADRIWIPAGEDHGGLNDRHAVVSRTHLIAYLDGLIPILTSPEKVLRAGLRRSSWNVEGYLLWQLRQAGFRNDVRRFAYTMALVRSPQDPPGWSPGVWDEERSVFIKTPEEIQAAGYNAEYLRTADDWRRLVALSPPDDHVLRRVALVRVPRWQSPWRFATKSARDPHLCPSGATLITGMAAGGTLYPRDSSDTRSKGCRIRNPWRLTPATFPERCLPWLSHLHYVTCCTCILGVTKSGRFVFRRLKSDVRRGIVHRLRHLVMRLLYGSLFSLHQLDVHHETRSRDR